MPTNILVPLDPTAVAARALGPAHDLAVAFGVPMTLFSSCWIEPERVRADLEAVAEKQEGLETRVVVAQGFAATEIARAVADEPGTVVCMSTMGHAGVGAVILGGVAQEVLNRTACPVVLVGPDCSPLALTETERRTEAALVLCFDGSPASEATVPLAREWAGALGLVAHVVAVTHHDGSRVGDRDAAPVRARALQLVDELRAQGIDARAAFPDCADAAHGLGRYVDEQPAALVVTAARRQDGIAHAVLGPVALRLVRHAAVPVLVAERHR